MCHSVEMYLPKITRDAAEEALRGAAPAPVAPSRPGLLTRLWSMLPEWSRSKAVAR